MTDKEKYKRLEQRYWEAETTPEEERDLSQYVTTTDDPTFDEVRFVLGYLSVGKQRKERRIQAIRTYSFAAVFAIAILVVVLGINLHNYAPMRGEDICVSYYYGEKIDDNGEIMDSVESSLSDFFSKPGN